jgi:hypothetical protein
MAAPTNREHMEDKSSAAEIHRAPTLKRVRAATKIRTNNATTSTEPSADTLIDPTLCTCGEPGFSHPPAAGAADRGRGMPDSPAGELDRLGRLTKLPLSAIDEEVND